jgi:hypothetical protein
MHGSRGCSLPYQGEPRSSVASGAETPRKRGPEAQDPMRRRAWQQHNGARLPRTPIRFPAAARKPLRAQDIAPR